MAQRTVWDHSDPALEMEEIDRIDEENRRKDLFQLLDGINSFSALPNEGKTYILPLPFVGT